MVAVLAHADAVISHRGAARLHRLDGFKDAAVEVSVRSAQRYVRSSVVGHHVSELSSADRVTVDRVPCTSMTRTLCDLGCVVDRDRLEQALDSALRRGVPVATIRRTAERLHRPGQKGTKAVLQLLADPARQGRLPDSWFERLVERMVRDPSLPPVVRQYEIFDDRGLFIARADLAIPAVKLVIECHSREFHFGPRRERLDQERENQLIVAGWQTLYLGYSSTGTPDQVLGLVRRTVAARSLSLSVR